MTNIPAILTLDLIVHGKVQGVYFRRFVKDAAREIGELNGWVENLKDGTVHVVVSGASDRVEALVAHCHEGPRRARVDRIEKTILDATPDVVGFDRR